MPDVTTVTLALLLAGVAGQADPAADPLLDWSPWQHYRHAVAHPAALIKAADLERARVHLERSDWARAYLEGLERGVAPWTARIDVEWLEQMVPSTTPGEILFTPCPACRGQGRAFHPHGQWNWSPEDPERLTCSVCETVFPNQDYPESIALQAHHGGGQTFTFYGGEPFTLFGYQAGRPSFSGNLRARKVEFVTGLCRRLAEAYALTGRVEYARPVRLILLRLAEVYPNWLVHAGYGEYADLDPHVAAVDINDLPEDELCPPPAVPDRRLHTGYWTAGRARAVGQEGYFTRRVVEAYDLTWGAAVEGRPIYSEPERLRIERDLLLESTVLLVADKGLNNKSVSNATAAALAGMVLGHPGMVRFGLDFFLKTVDGWFLPDGGTSESWSYALMTLNGIHPLGVALQGYSDPPGYVDGKGERIESLNLYRHPAYRRVWQAMFNGLQGDLRYPPLADGHRTSALGPLYAELMAGAYPKEPQYLALLKMIAGDDLSRGYPPYALYYREPGLEEEPSPPLNLPDHLFPALQIGYLRSGPHGREGALVLSASDWGGHHHLDSLSLYWWQHGEELLSDLGYLWDHPMGSMTRRTFAHNTVMVDGSEQATQGRGGRFVFLGASPSIKAMEAESQAYPQASLYRRTVVQVQVAPGRLYLFDLFRVQGGRRHDYVFHGPGNELLIETPPLTPQEMEFDLQNLRGSGDHATWRLTWTVNDTLRLQALWVNAPGELSLIGDGWGQRDYRNSDVGAVLPYVVRRRHSGEEGMLSVFATVFEGYASGQALVRSVRPLPVPERAAGNVAAVVVQTTESTDYVVSCREPRPVTLETPDGPLEVSARLAVLRTREGRAVDAFAVEDALLRWRGADVEAH